MSQQLNTTPKQAGFFMPAEWHTHSATWLSWPNNATTWTKDMSIVEATFLEIMQYIAESEQVNLLVDSSTEQERIMSLMKHTDINLLNINFVLEKTHDIWIRDYGPNYLIRSDKGKAALAYNGWIFDAWGNKYDDLKKDGELLSRLEAQLPMHKFSPGIILEGGSIDVNGAGDCLTTRQCLLNKNRNAHLNQAEIEMYLKDYLGLERIHWLNEGITGDDTDGHIDDIARFVNKDTIVIAQPNIVDKSNQRILLENKELLESAKGANGKCFEVIALPAPRSMQFEGCDLPASYANFYICNSSVLVPTFNDPNDKIALSILDDIFVNRKVVGIDCSVMLRGLGTIHCASQQVPIV
ncbi:MAG: agmatine deiminase [Candidatus Omnitrophota bacterium]|jgi:agmatine deiminase